MSQCIQHFCVLCGKPTCTAATCKETGVKAEVATVRTDAMLVQH